MKTFTSKITLAVLLLGLLIAYCPCSKAQAGTSQSEVQSLPIPVSLDFLTNLPSTTNFSSAKFALETGVATKNGSVANFIKTDAYLRTNWMLSFEIQNAPVSTVVDSLSVYGGYRHAWANAEVYAQVGGRRTWATASEPPSWQGVGLIGASWFPMTGGRVAVTGSAGLTTAPRGGVFSSAPGFEVRAGLKLLF